MPSFVKSLSLLALSAVASAHFQLQFPPPRGAFVEDNEPNFCDGYTNVTTNRTDFPLNNGYFVLNSEHPSWTAAVYLTTASGSADADSFQDFEQVTSFFTVSGEGAFCIPLNLSTTNGTNLAAGTNVSMQILYDGGDGNLFQCADITLSENATISTACTNTTTSDSSSDSGALQISRGWILPVLTVVFASIFSTL